MKSAKHAKHFDSSPVGDGEAMIEFDNVVKILGGRRVLDGVSFTVRRGETFVVCGPSGVGKSVTLKHMVRLLTPDEGDVRVAGESISGATGRQLSRMRDRFGYLFQGGALLAWLSVAENVELPLREKTTLSDGEIRERVQRVLEMVELGGEGDKRPSEISGGMRKRAPRRYQSDASAGEPTASFKLDPAFSNELAHLRIRYKLPNESVSKLIESPVMDSGINARGSDSFNFAASVAAFGQKLRGGQYLESFTYDDIASLARQSRANDQHGYRSEFMQLVSLAGTLDKTNNTALR